MDWLTLWAFTGNKFTEDFKRWVESETDGVPDPQTFSLMLTEAAQAYMAETGKQAAPSWSMFNIPGVQSDFTRDTPSTTVTPPPVAGPNPNDIQVTTDALGFAHTIVDGVAYIGVPSTTGAVVLGKDAKGQPIYGDWKRDTSVKAENTTRFVMPDGSFQDTPYQPTGAAGYFDSNGVFKSLVENKEMTPYQQWETQRTTQQDALTAQRQAASDAETQKMNLWNIQRDLLADADKRYGREWEAIQGRQSAQAAQDLRDAAALNEAEARWNQPDAPKFASNAPVDWISVWKSNQQPNQQGQRQSAFQYYDKMLNGAQTAKLAQDTGTTLNRIQIWDNAAQAYRPETDFEFDYRTRVQPIRQMVQGIGPASAQMQGITEWSPAQANIQWGREQGLTGNAMDAFTNAQTEYRPVGPQRPSFLSGVVGTQNGSAPRLENVGGTGNFNPFANQINLNTLGRTGNAVAPVSAQMYQGWTPSQQQGYQGLVNSRVRGSVGGAPEDYFANVNNMWTASKTGSKATRRW